MKKKLFFIFVVLALLSISLTLIFDNDDNLNYSQEGELYDEIQKSIDPNFREVPMSYIGEKPSYYDKETKLIKYK